MYTFFFFTSSAGCGIFRKGSWTGRNPLPPKTWASGLVSVLEFPILVPVSQQRTLPTLQPISDFLSIVCSSHSLRGLHLHDFLGHFNVEAGVTTTGLLDVVSFMRTGSNGRQHRTVPYSQLTAKRKSISSIGQELIGSHLHPSALLSFSCCWLWSGARVDSWDTGRIITLAAPREWERSSSFALDSVLNNLDNDEISVKENKITIYVIPWNQSFLLENWLRSFPVKVDWRIRLIMRSSRRQSTRYYYHQASYCELLQTGHLETNFWLWLWVQRPQSHLFLFR